MTVIEEKKLPTKYVEEYLGKKTQMLAEVIVGGIYLCEINNPHGRQPTALGAVGSKLGPTCLPRPFFLENTLPQIIFYLEEPQIASHKAWLKGQYFLPRFSSHKEKPFPQLSKLMLSLWQLNRQ